MNEKNIFVLTEKLAVETEKLQKGNLEVIQGFGQIFEKIKINSQNAIKAMS